MKIYSLLKCNRFFILQLVVKLILIVIKLVLTNRNCKYEELYNKFHLSFLIFFKVVRHIVAIQILFNVTDLYLRVKSTINICLNQADTSNRTCIIRLGRQVGILLSVHEIVPVEGNRYGSSDCFFLIFKHTRTLL